MARRPSYLAAVVLLVLALPTAATAAVELRSAASLDLEIAPPLAFGFEEQLRVDLRPGETQEWLQGVVVAIKPLRWLHIEPQYRFSLRPGVTIADPEVRHRLAVALRVRCRLGVVRLSLRERYQLRLTNRGDTPRQQLVSKVTAKFRHKAMPVIPAVWIEFFLRLPEDDDKVLADKLRVGLGLAIPTRVVEIEFGLQFEKSIKNPSDPVLPILALSFEFELDPAKKKRKKERKKKRRKKDGKGADGADGADGTG
jgi:hypothetical protein